MPKLPSNPEALMPLVGHLTELRQVLLISLTAFVVAAGGLMFWTNQLIKFLLTPLYQLHITPIQIRPMEYFFAMLKIATIGGIIAALPVFLWQGYRFTKPAIKPGQSGYVLLLAPVAIIMFATGVVFGYLTAYKVALRFLVLLGQGVAVPYISISEFIDFTISFLLPFGIVFEMPIAVIFLTKFGIITPSYLAGKRKYAFFITFVAAIILVPDPSLLTQSILAVPMYLLFEASVFLSRLVYRRRQGRVLPEPAQPSTI